MSERKIVRKRRNLFSCEAGKMPSLDEAFSDFLKTLWGMRREVAPVTTLTGATLLEVSSA